MPPFYSPTPAAKQDLGRSGQLVFSICYYLIYIYIKSSNEREIREFFVAEKAFCLMQKAGKKGKKNLRKKLAYTSSTIKSKKKQYSFIRQGLSDLMSLRIIYIHPR